MMRNRIALLLLRGSLGVVFLLFGIGKLNNDLWAQTMRSMDSFKGLPWDIQASIIIVGVIEIITGAFLILGFYTRYIAGVAAVLLIAIVWLLQFQELRDWGLLGIALYLTLIKEQTWGIDWLVQNQKRNEK
jgi:uncharacterized membrane protein YphA (DoxX/SURF4 family)